MKWTNVFCLICISLCATHSTNGRDATGNIMSRADSLFAIGSYFEASIEYERAIYLSESSRERVLANLGKAEALKQTGEFKKAYDDLQRSLMFQGDDSLRMEVMYQVAFCAYMSGMIAEANAMIMRIRHSFDGQLHSKMYLLESLVKVEMQQWEELREHLSHWLEKFSANNMQKNDVLDQYDALLEDNKNRKNLSPERARLWSTFLPGAGQLYAGEPGWAFLNVFSQLAGLASFGLLAYNGFYIASVVAGLGPFQAFYFGGIKQAYELTERNSKSRLEEVQTALNFFLLDVAIKLEQ